VFKSSWNSIFDVNISFEASKKKKSVLPHSGICALNIEYRVWVAQVQFLSGAGIFFSFYRLRTNFKHRKSNSTNFLKPISFFLKFFSLNFDLLICKIDSENRLPGFAVWGFDASVTGICVIDVVTRYDHHELLAKRTRFREGILYVLEVEAF